jgi:hypothetical protein
MSNHIQNATPLSQREVEQICATAWERAARINPMLLVTLNPDYVFPRLREMVRDCLSKGLSHAEICRHTANELLGSAAKNLQPNNADASPQSHRHEQSSS